MASSIAVSGVVMSGLMRPFGGWYVGWCGEGCGSPAVMDPGHLPTTCSPAEAVRLDVSPVTMMV
jgi:hypothetical protein